jgi:hypothetical protein
LDAVRVSDVHLKSMRTVSVCKEENGIASGRCFL